MPKPDKTPPAKPPVPDDVELPEEVERIEPKPQPLGSPPQGPPPPPPPSPPPPSPPDVGG